MGCINYYTNSFAGYRVLDKQLDELANTASNRDVKNAAVAVRDYDRYVFAHQPGNFDTLYKTAVQAMSKVVQNPKAIENFWGENRMKADRNISLLDISSLDSEGQTCFDSQRYISTYVPKDVEVLRKHANDPTGFDTQPAVSPQPQSAFCPRPLGKVRDPGQQISSNIQEQLSTYLGSSGRFPDDSATQYSDLSSSNQQILRCEHADEIKKLQGEENIAADKQIFKKKGIDGLAQKYYQKNYDDLSDNEQRDIDNKPVVVAANSVQPK